jgi:hypothetical protein
MRSLANYQQSDTYPETGIWEVTTRALDERRARPLADQPASIVVGLT